jgi:integrase
MNALAPAVVQRLIDNYVAEVPAAHWSEIESFVRDSVTSFGPQTTGVARNYLAATAKFGHWAWQRTGADLDPQIVFRPAMVGRFIHVVMRDHSPSYRYHTAQRLNLMVAHFTGTTPARQHLAEPHPARPYAPSELIEFRSSAVRRNNPERRRNANMLLGLGAGAGLRAEEIANTRVGDITTDPHGLLVTVRGAHPRTVPVHADWVTILTAPVSGRPNEDFAITGYRLPGYAARVVHQLGIDDPDEPTPSATRLRATWLVGQLNAGVPLDLLLHLAGLTSPTSLTAYLRAITTHHLADYRYLVTGQENDR